MGLESILRAIKRDPGRAIFWGGALMFALVATYYALKNGDSDSASHIVSDVHENAKTLWSCPGSVPQGYELLYVGQDTNDNGIADHVGTVFTDSAGQVVKDMYDPHDFNHNGVVDPGREIQDMMDMHPEAQNTEYALENLEP